MRDGETVNVFGVKIDFDYPKCSDLFPLIDYLTFAIQSGAKNDFHPILIFMTQST